MSQLRQTRINLSYCLFVGTRHLDNRTGQQGTTDNNLSTEELRKIYSEHKLEREDYDPQAVQMKLRVGFNRAK